MAKGAALPPFAEGLLGSPCRASQGQPVGATLAAPRGAVALAGGVVAEQIME